MNLNIPVDQRKQIDEIIADAYNQVKAIEKDQKKTGLLSSINVNNFASYLLLVNDVRMNTNSKIMQLLPPEQRSIFESQIETSQERTERNLITLLALDLSETQQIVIAKLLLKDQKQVWAIVSNKSLSWEERRKKLTKLNTLKKINKYLTKTQLTTWMEWNQLFKLVDR